MIIAGSDSRKILLLLLNNSDKICSRTVKMFVMFIKVINLQVKIEENEYILIPRNQTTGEIRNIEVFNRPFEM